MKKRFPITQRKEVFDCSCCPPNITRFIPSIANYIYTNSEETLRVNQFMESEASLTVGGREVILRQETSYPADGRVRISVHGGDVQLKVRIPEHARATYAGETERGYASLALKDGESVTLTFDMTPRLIEANPLVVFNAGRYAVQRGPVVYCMEAVDNGPVLRDLRLRRGAAFEEGYDEALGVPTLTVAAYRRKPRAALYAPLTDEREETVARLIPYYAFANRGESEMQVWHLVE